MSTTYDHLFTYVIKGKYLYLYEIDEYNNFVPPTVDITDGLKIEYLSNEDVFIDTNGNPVSSPDEDSILNINDAYIESLVEYIKSKLTDDVNLKEYYKRNTETELAEANSATKASPKRVISVYPYAIR